MPSLVSFDDALERLENRTKSSPEIIDPEKLMELFKTASEQAKKYRWPLVGLALGLGLIVGIKAHSNRKKHS